MSNIMHTAQKTMLFEIAITHKINN